MNLHKQLILKALVISFFIPTLFIQSMHELRVTLPGQQTLRQRLSKNGFDHLMEKSNIVRDLANKEKTPTDVVQTIDTALKMFSEDVQLPFYAQIVASRKPDLIRLVLQEHPDALETLGLAN